MLKRRVWTKWTEAMELDLARMAWDGKNAIQIAIVLGVSEPAVKRRAYDMRQRGIEIRLSRYARNAPTACARWPRIDANHETNTNQ